MTAPGQVVASMSMSLDGYVEGPAGAGDVAGRGVTHLHYRVRRDAGR